MWLPRKLAEYLARNHAAAAGMTVHIHNHGASDPAEVRRQVIAGSREAAPQIISSGRAAQREESLRRPHFMGG